MEKKVINIKINIYFIYYNYMDTNYILKKSMSKINSLYKRNIIADLAIDIQHVIPLLVKRYNWNRYGVYLFIDENFVFLNYVNCSKNKSNKEEIIKDLKFLKKQTKYILFIKEDRRDYKKYKYGNIVEKYPCYHELLHKRLMQYKKQKHFKTPHYLIIQYSEEILNKLSKRMLYDYGGKNIWEDFMDDFLDIWNNFKYYYIKVCNEENKYIDDFLYWKVRILDFYKHLMKELE